MPGQNVQRKRHSSRHRKSQLQHALDSTRTKKKNRKRDDREHTNIYSASKQNNKKYNLKVDLGATKIIRKTNTFKSRSKPESHTIDLTQFPHAAAALYAARKSCSNTKSARQIMTAQYGDRFKKRISAPIIVAQSGSATANANLDGLTTPYYTNMEALSTPLPISLKEADDEAAHEADDDYLDDDEINEMIRSYRRSISKSRKSGLRSYSKTRRVSQKLFGLIESISTDNGYCLEPHVSAATPTKKKKKKKNQMIEGTNDDNDISNNEDIDDYHITLAKYGYVEVGLIAKSLQGIVIEARKKSDVNNNNSVIIKMTDKELYFNKMSNKRGKSLYVEEDIIKEKKLLMYLTANNPPEELVKFLGFFEDKYRFYVVQENGGNDFFNWIVKCHKWIRAGKISLKQWSLYICDLMMQITRFIKWLHCKMNVCHLDISLENMLIKNNKYKSDGAGGIRLSRKMQIKICDFGLAEYFQPKYGFLCRKYVGKTHYKAPKVYEKKVAFDARAADIWSLGVSFFMMIIGAPPYKLPIADDDHYALIAQQNDIMLILKRWGRNHYCNKYAQLLLNDMLQINEEKRSTIYDIENHAYFKQESMRSMKMSAKKHKNYHHRMRMRTKKEKKRSSSKNKKKRKKYKENQKPSNPITSENIFENLVMSQDHGQLLKYRKRKITSQ